MSELSSNWKKLQEKLKTQPETTTSVKRKAESQPSTSTKKAKTDSTLKKPIKAPKKDLKATKTASKKPPMGGVHSSPAQPETKQTITPSLALWAADNDISAESLAEAYDLGTRDPKTVLAAGKDKINHGISEGMDVGKYVAIDCEMVGVGPGGHDSVLARVSVVDFHGKQVYDSYVKPTERVTDWRTKVSGISPKQMRFARDFKEVQQTVSDILDKRIVVGHDLKHDLDCLMLSHPFRDIRDTAKYHSFRKFGHGPKPALRTLAQEILGVEIQSGAHSSIEDARVTMLLFRKHKSGFDVEHSNRYTPKPTSNGQGKPKKKRK